MTPQKIGGTDVLFYPATGQRIATESDAVTVIGDAFSVKANLVAIPSSRFDDMFFHLSTRMAGEFIQKFVNYRIRLAIIGDISDHTGSSQALRDYVFEANRRDEVWFLPDTDALIARLETGSAPTNG
jgi:hypothetical protein